MDKEIPVYLFTGFLEAGKTSFIQDTLEDGRFNAGERTLVLLCEEGTEELDHGRFSFDNVTEELLDDAQKLDPEYLDMLVEKHGAERVMIEYNGMWMLDDLFQAMPENWLVYEEFCFADATTIMAYNSNMRQLVYDKLKTCDMMVFNRWSDDMDMMEYHKLVRGANMRSDIAYERPDGVTTYDDIEDPMPFDVNAPVIHIEDDEYALFYRDLSEKMDEYDGKTVHFKAITGNSGQLPANTFVCGRKIMSCCVEDIQMAGLACRWSGDGSQLDCLWTDGRPAQRQWIWIQAKIKVMVDEAYDGRGPVLMVESVKIAPKPEEEVTTFY